MAIFSNSEDKFTDLRLASAFQRTTQKMKNCTIFKIIPTLHSTWHREIVRFASPQTKIKMILSFHRAVVQEVVEMSICNAFAYGWRTKCLSEAILICGRIICRNFVAKYVKLLFLQNTISMDHICI